MGGEITSDSGLLLLHSGRRTDGYRVSYPTGVRFSRENRSGF